MQIFFTALHVLLCVFMIFVILLQPGKDAGMGSALGGGSASSAFGGRGAVTMLSKITGICAGLFFLTSLGLSFVGTHASVASTGLPPVVPAPVNAPLVPAAAPVEGAPAPGAEAVDAPASAPVSPDASTAPSAPAPAPAP